MADVHPQDPPPGGDESLQWVILGVGVIWNCSWCLAFTILRIFVRTHITKLKLWWDDYFIIGAAFSELVGTILVIVEVHLGFGRHQYYLRPWEITYYLKLTYVEWIQTFFTLMCTKVSIAFFLLRIPIQKKHIFPLYAGIAVLIISNLVLTLMWIFQCWPVQAVWDLSVPIQHCLNPDVVSNVILAQGIIAAISDFAFALYPILILYHLNMRVKDKVGLCVLMGLGLITGAACVIRMTWNWQSVPDDLTYGGMTNYVWRNIEIGLGISLASVPPLVPGYKLFRRKLQQGWTNTFGGTASTATLPTAMAPVSHKHKPSDVSQLLQGIAVDEPVQTSITGPDPEAEKNEEEVAPPVEGAIWKVTQVDVDFEEQRKRSELNISGGDVEKGTPDSSDEGKGRSTESEEFAWGVGASERPAAELRIHDNTPRRSEEVGRPRVDVDLRPSFEENRDMFGGNGR